MMQVEIRRHTPQNPWTYSMLVQRQSEIVESLWPVTHTRDIPRIKAEGELAGRILLSELAPVITYGRRTPASDLPVWDDGSRLAGRKVDLYATERGGLATYHGPGQWVLFPVFPLGFLVGDPRGVRQVVGELLEIGLQVARTYSPEAEVRCGLEQGIWTKRGKVGSLGIQVYKGVLKYGLSLNGFRTQESFLGFRPCGLDAPIDFLLGSQAEEAGFAEMGMRLLESTREVFSSSVQGEAEFSSSRDSLFSSSIASSCQKTLTMCPADAIKTGKGI